MLGHKVKTLILVFLIGLTFRVSAAIDTTNPQIGNIQKTFVEQAKTRLANTYDINMPLTGKLGRIVLKEGSSVKKGQVIAMADQEPLIEAVKQLQARAKTFQALYVFQQKTVDRRKFLAAEDYIEKQALDEAVSRRNAWQAQIAETVANLKIAQYNLKESIIRSPINGIVLNRYTQGDSWLTMGTSLFTLGDLNDLEVICDVLSQEAEQLKVGGKVSLTSEGNPLVIPGKIIQIYPAGFTKKSSLGVDEQRVNVIISIPNITKEKLGVGYRLQAEFFVNQPGKNVLLVPRFSVLRDNQNNYYVFKVVENKLQRQLIKIGIVTDRYIEIVGGLSAKDIIVSQPTADMKSGMKA